MKKINISGEIGFDVLPFMIQEQFEGETGDIEIDLSSIGGSLFGGIEIYNMIREYKRNNPNTQMILNIKGLAVSAASYIASNPAFDLVTIEDNATFMIHNPLMGMIGDYRDMQKAAEHLERLAIMVSESYTKKSGKLKKEIRDMMDKETWFYGKEIIKAGFADEIISTQKSYKNKESAIAESKVMFKSLKKKIQETEMKQSDFEQLAAMIEYIDIEMPYPNEHAARIVDPGKFQKDSFRRKNIKSGIDIIIGKLKGETSTTTQAYRFDKNKFTVAQAKKWLKDNNIKYILFEPASEEKNIDKNDIQYNNEHANKPAAGGKNNNTEDVLMNLAELKEKHPEIYAEAIEAGKIEGSKEEKERVKTLLEMKNKKDFENLEMVRNRIDEGIANGEDVMDVKIGIQALLSRDDVRAAMDTNEIGDLHIPDKNTVSGEAPKIEDDNRRTF